MNFGAMGFAGQALAWAYAAAVSSVLITASVWSHAHEMLGYLGAVRGRVSVAILRGHAPHSLLAVRSPSTGWHHSPGPSTTMYYPSSGLRSA